MLDLMTAFEDFCPELDVQEPLVDGDFITNFLQPYFNELPRELLAAKVAEVIAQGLHDRHEALVGHR